MNWVDIAIIAVIVLSSLFGLWRGLVREVFSLVTWVAALIIARVYSASLAPLFAGTLENETTRLVAAFVVLFLVTLIVGALVNHLLSNLLNIAGLKLADRLLGGVFGVVRGGIIVMLFIYVLSGFVSTSRYWQESQLIPYGISMIEWSRLFILDLTDQNVSLDAGLVQ